MRALSVLCLGIFLLIAGCVAFPSNGPSQQERPVTVVLNNSANSTHSFEVWVVELPANVSTRRDDGLTATWPIGEGLATTNPGDGHVYTSVEVPDSARLHGQFMLSPGESNQSAIEDLPRDFAVVVVVNRAENESIEWVSANCAEQALVGLEVTARPDSQGGVFASYGCR